MKYAISTTVMGTKGQPMQHPDKDSATGTRDATYADLLGLLVQLQQQEAASAYKLYRILTLVDEATPEHAGAHAMVELSAEQTAFVKEQAPKVMSPLAYGRLVDFLEQTTAPSLRAVGRKSKPTP